MEENFNLFHLDLSEFLLSVLKIFIFVVLNFSTFVITSYLI